MIGPQKKKKKKNSGHCLNNNADVFGLFKIYTDLLLIGTSITILFELKMISPEQYNVNVGATLCGSEKFKCLRLYNYVNEYFKDT